MKGQLTIINLLECNEALVCSRKHLESFGRELCKVIHMNPYGKPIVMKFGKGKLKGYSAIQMIETSSITVHLDEFENKAFIDIFSCKEFDAFSAKSFSKKYFKSKKAMSRTIMRK